MSRYKRQIIKEVAEALRKAKKDQDRIIDDAEDEEGEPQIERQWGLIEGLELALKIVKFSHVKE